MHGALHSSFILHRACTQMAQLPKPRWAEAVQYYRRAAEQGNADAVAALGHAYANGLGVEQNNKTAVKLLTRAAEAGHPSGLYGLGYMYLTGQPASQWCFLAFAPKRKGFLRFCLCLWGFLINFVLQCHQGVGLWQPACSP